jgi:hypothetical protein
VGLIRQWFAAHPRVTPLLVVVGLALSMLRAPEPSAAGVVLVAGPIRDSVAQVVAQLRPYTGAVVDTLDLSVPGTMRVALRLPAVREDASRAASLSYHATMDALSHLVWRRLRAEFGPRIGDTVIYSARQGFLSGVGLPAAGRRTSYRRVVVCRDRRWIAEASLCSNERSNVWFMPTGNPRWR